MINFLFVLIFVVFFFREKISKFFNSLYLLLKKKRFLKIFLKEINELIKENKNKETELIFNFEIIERTNLLYDKLTIFGKTYLIEPNKPLIIKYNYKNLIKSDIIDKIILSKDSISKSFLIGVNLRQENYYQTFIDISKENTNATEIVYYSKNNDAPNNLKAGSVNIKNYEKNFIPRVKRFCVINIDVKNIIFMLNFYTSNSINKNEIFQNDLFINLINDNKKVIGRIFKQTEEKGTKNFSQPELDFLKEFQKEILKEELFPFVKNFNKFTSPSNEYKIIRRYQNLMEAGFNKLNKNNIRKKMYNTCYFVKYFDKEPTNEEINIIELVILLHFIDDYSITKAYNYIIEKNKIFNGFFEFSHKEKLFILLTIYLNVEKNLKSKFHKLYDLSSQSSFLQSEILYKNIIMNLTYDSSLYFLYLQLNSNCDIDMISSNSWFKIKKIPLIDIQTHLLSELSPYFFTFNSKSPKAFTNPQTLLKNYNENPDVGYIYYNNLVDSVMINNTMKIFFIKFHEESHCKLKGGFIMKNSARFLLNYDLKVIDSHYDTIKKDIAKDESNLGETIGEGGYAAEIYIFDSYQIINQILLSKENLEELSDIKLYTGTNFSDLKK